MKKNFSKKWIWGVIFVFAVGAVFGTRAVVSAAGRQEAERTAREYVPSDSVLEFSERDDGMYQFQFYSESEGMVYEVEVSQKTGAVREIERKLRGGMGSVSVTLTEEQVKALVEERHPGAEISAIQLGIDDGRYSYEVYFRSDDLYGTLEFNAETGALLESKVKFGTPVVIPSESGSTSAETSFLKEEEIRAKVEAAYPGSRMAVLEMECEDGRYIYEAEFFFTGKKFEVVYDALNGELLSEKTKETNWIPEITTASASQPEASTTAPESTKDAENQGTETTETPASGREKIGNERAKEIALGKAEAENAKITEMKLEREDGRLVYEGEMKDASYEYEFEIDAYTGVVLKWEKEAVKKRQENTSEHPAEEPNTIGKDAAASIALAKAKESGAFLVKIKLDHEDGRLVYEGEIRDNSYEYEFEIDAYTGTVLDWDVEQLDADDWHDDHDDDDD